MAHSGMHLTMISRLDGVTRTSLRNGRYFFYSSAFVNCHRTNSTWPIETCLIASEED